MNPAIADGEKDLTGDIDLLGESDGDALTTITCGGELLLLNDLLMLLGDLDLLMLPDLPLLPLFPPGNTLKILPTFPATLTFP